MHNKIARRLFLGFIQIHILHHASKESFFGAWMIEELKEHGYNMSPGTLYPLLHDMESAGLLKREDILVDKKIRKYYNITEAGTEVLEEARNKAAELVREINE